MAKLSLIQIGRAFAASSVVICHTLHEAEKWPDVDPRLVAFSHYMPFGSGVDIFFVISGFVMYYISQSKHETPGYWRTFAENRVTRIVPVYWFFTLIMVALLAAMPQAFDSARFEPWQIIRSFFFLPGPHFEFGMPILALGWTLNLEMYFYALFALSLALVGRHAVPVLSAFLIATVALHPVLARTGFFPLEFWSQPIILDFVAGMGLAALRHRGTSWTRGTGLFALALSLIVFVMLPAFDLDWMGDYSKLFFGVAATLFVAGLVFPPDVPATNWLSRSAVTVGDASYTLYLCHPFVLTAIFLVWARIPALQLAGGWFYTLIAVLAALIAAVCGYYLIERPLTELAKGRRPAFPLMSLRPRG